MSSYKKPMKLNVQKNSKNLAFGKNQPFQRPERKIPEALKKQTTDRSEPQVVASKN